MKLLVDMNLSPGWISYLAVQGFEAVHWSAVGAPDSTDQVIFDHARTAGMTIFTHDLDFTTMLALSGAHRPSLIQARVQDITPGISRPQGRRGAPPVWG
jgi:predicted nuclease of predicted toxin-antitoxin system